MGELLAMLQSDTFATRNLRLFEISLLAVWVGISFDVESLTGDPIMADKSYFYVIEDGFHYASEGNIILDLLKGGIYLPSLRGK